MAERELGLFYESGRGTTQDLVAAYHWYALAAANGDQEAMPSTNALAQRLTPDQLKAAQSMGK